jgi:hypothetical protein
MKAREILDGLEKLGWFNDYIDITCWRDGAQVVSSQYGEPYAEDGFSLQDELNREVISFSCEHEGKIVIYLKGDR